MAKSTENSTRYGASVTKKTTFVVILTVLVALFIFMATRGDGVPKEDGFGALGMQSGGADKENPRIDAESGKEQGTVNSDTNGTNSNTNGAVNSDTNGTNGAGVGESGTFAGNGLSLALTGAELALGVDGGEELLGNENAQNPQIVAFNLSLADSIYIDYAVWVPDGCESFGILVWERSAPANFTHNEGGTEITTGAWQTTYGEKSVWVFAYRGIAMKELADDVYAVPFYRLDGGYVYGEAQKFSVVQYALMQEGNERLAPVLDSLLSFGAQAQLYFNYRTDRLADSGFVKVTVHGGLLPDRSNFGLFVPGVDTLPAPTAPEGVTGEFDGWYADADFTEKLETVSATTAEAYAKWKKPAEVLVKTDFEEKVGASTAPLYNGGVTFNAEASATLETLRDENGTPYLKISSGRDTTVQISTTNTGVSFADMIDFDVFSFTVSLGIESGKRVLSTEEFGIMSDKNKSGRPTSAVLNLFSIESDGAVCSAEGEELGVLSSAAALTVRVTVDFAKGELTYYGDGGAIIAKEEVVVPSGLGISTAKEWQALMEKYMLYTAFEAGNTIRIYEISVAAGEAFAP